MFECSKCNRSVGPAVRSCRHRKHGECPLEISTGKLAYPKGQALIMACSGLLFIYFTLSLTSAFNSNESAGTLEVIVTISMVSLFLVVGGIVSLIGIATLCSKRFIYVDRAAENQATVVTLRGFDYAFEAVTSLRLVRFSHLQLFGDQHHGKSVFCGVPAAIIHSKEALRAAIQQVKAGDISEDRTKLIYESAHDALVNALSGLLFRGLITGKVGELRVSGDESVSTSSREILLLSAIDKISKSSLKLAADPAASNQGCTPSALTALESALLLKINEWELSKQYDHSKLGPYLTMLLSEFADSRLQQSVEIAELALRDASFATTSAAPTGSISAWEGFEQLYPRLAQATSKQLMQELGISKVKKLGWFANFSWTSFRSGFLATLFVLFLLVAYFHKVEQAQKATQFISEHAEKLSIKAGEKLAGKSLNLSVPATRSAKLQNSLNDLFDAITPDLNGTETGARMDHYKDIIKRDFSSAKFQREYAHYKKLFSTAFGSTNESVRLAAVKTLASVEGNAAEITATLQEQLEKDPSPLVRDAISDALESRGVGGSGSFAAGAESAVSDAEDYINDSTNEAIDDAESSALDEVNKLLDQ
jgi:hypothetical protein